MTSLVSSYHQTQLVLLPAAEASKVNEDVQPVLVWGPFGPETAAPFRFRSLRSSLCPPHQFQA